MASILRWPNLRCHNSGVTVTWGKDISDKSGRASTGAARAVADGGVEDGRMKSQWRKERQLITVAWNERRVDEEDVCRKRT